jgi:hypothetical protein
LSIGDRRLELTAANIPHHFKKTNFFFLFEETETSLECCYL